MFPSSTPLQGGTGISLNPTPPPKSVPSKLQVQGPSPMSLLEPVYTAPSAPSGYSAPAYSGGGGGGGASAAAYVAPPPDPYARWGGKANYDRLNANYDEQINNVYGSSRDAAGNYARGYDANIQDFLDSLHTGQRNINERGIQNELAKKQGSMSIMDMISRGIRSGGVMLANMNASDSSAAELLAKAYGNLGQRELGKVGNQYDLENRNIGMAQDDFNTNRASGLRKLDVGKNDAINSIVTDARNKLAQLDADMANASLPDKIDIEQRKNDIKGQVLNTLSQYDQKLASGASAVNPSSTDDRRRTATELANSGVAATNPFDVTTQIPTQLQNTGPFSGTMPLFTLPRRKET
jgi:hypothetical protein